MKRYRIRHTENLSEMEEGRIVLAPWETAYCPDTRFYLGWTEAGLQVCLRCYESDPVAEVAERNGPVSLDSCMELFFSPSPDLSRGYFNFETNARPVMLSRYGLSNRPPERPFLDWPMEDFRLTNSRGQSPEGRDYWQNRYVIPAALLKRYVPETSLAAGELWRGNLYKCGSTRQIPHHLVWNDFDRVRFPRPSFHEPAAFGELLLTE